VRFIGPESLLVRPRDVPRSKTWAEQQWTMMGECEKGWGVGERKFWGTDSSSSKSKTGVLYGINVKPRLHDATGTTGWQPAVSCKQTSNRLSNRVVQPVRLSNRVVQPVWQPAVYTIQPFCQTSCTTRFDNWLNVCIHDTTGCQPGLTTGLTTGCIVYTNICPVVKRGWQPDWQQVLSCKRGLRKQEGSCLTDRL